MSAAELATASRSCACDADTHALGASLARTCRIGDCILLNGDLGAGKTTFARGFIASLAAGAEEIVSPTFTLVQTYPTKSGQTLFHFDLYRLKDPLETQEIGLDEALQTGITLIEWPGLIHHQLPAQALEVGISMGEEAQTRHFTFAGLSRVWENRLKEL